jgi:predicted ester cyclase
MKADVEAAVRGAIGAINDRAPRTRAKELVDPSIVRHDLVQLFPDSTGTSGGSDFVEMIIAAMPDFRLDIEDILSTGDRAAVRLRMTGDPHRRALARLSADGQGALGKRGVDLPV